MIFILSKIFGILTSVGTVLLLFCVVGLVLTHRRNSRIGRSLMVIGVVGFVLVLLLPIDQWALLPLEDRFPQVAQPPAHVDGIIVLGGATIPDMMAERGLPS